MSALLTSTTIALLTISAVFAATFPDLANSLAPIFDTGNEYAAFSIGMLVTIPGLALLTLIAGATRD
jgi:hypothetical protein